LCLFFEIFSTNHDKCPEGLKVNDTWSVFIDITIGAIFAKTNADKKFLSLAAQKGILAAAEVSPIPATSNILIKNSSSKAVSLAEFACKSLEALVKTAPNSLYHEQHNEEQCL